MPDFGSSFSGLANDRRLTEAELVRAIRFMVAAEYEAIQLYMQLAESTDNKLAVEVLKDIADEERVHAGSFCDFCASSPPTRRSSTRKGRRKSKQRSKSAGDDRRNSIMKVRVDKICVGCQTCVAFAPKCSRWRTTSHPLVDVMPGT
jgi:hypothetical protein